MGRVEPQTKGKMKIFQKILIANRGEIAVRVMKAAQEMGIKTVAVYSKADQDSLHISSADEAYCIGEESLAETYLNVGKIMEVALKSQSQAIHPGYGFLAENPDLVAACEKNKIAFIGPNTKAIHLMGNKIEARAFVEKLNIPMTKGVTGKPEDLKRLAKNIELPILVKAAAGGGGKGMRIVHDWNDLDSTIESTSREALAYFGDAEVFVEKYVEDPRHIEIQILGDTQGNIIHLYERECSIQRRYQKIIEESPSPTLTQEIREKMGNSAVDIAKAIGYYSAGTIEFLVDKDLNYYFLEMNTRIQVEHPVTEMVTGVDIVKEQIRVAAGLPLSYQQSDIQQNGYAIEARIYAEEPEKDFLPSPGQLTFYKEANGQHIRVDSGIDKAVEIKSFFDPMIAKLIVWDETRADCITQLAEALQDYVVLGIPTNIPFMFTLIQMDDFKENNISTKYCDIHSSKIVEEQKKNKDLIKPDILAFAYIAHQLTPQKNSASVWHQIGYWRIQTEFKLKIDQKDLHYQLLSHKNNNIQLFADGEHLSFNYQIINENSVQIHFNDVDYLLYFAENEEGDFDAWYQGQYFKLHDKAYIASQDFYESIIDEKGASILKTPMPGKLIKINVEKGQYVKKGEILLIVEAMKMENNIAAPREGIVEEIFAQEGEMVNGNKVLLKLEDITEL